MGNISSKKIMKKILITGYKGMIGSRLYSYLQSFNEYVVKGLDIIDNTGDIRLLRTFEEFDIIIHCAALTSVTESIIHPNEYYETNVLGTFNVLANYPTSKIIFMSTSAVYGEGLNHAETDKLQPQVPYAQNKVDAEFYIQALSKNWLILRLANIYGGKKGERNVYQVFEEEDILPIYGDGSSLRDYLHVDELVKIIHKGFDKNGIYNIGSGTTKTVLEITKEFKKPLKFLPAREGEIKYISLDISKAQNEGLICI